MDRAAPIPHFSLYGEPLQAVRERFIHAETIASRSSPQNWTIRMHRHAELHHLLIVQAGGGVVQAEASQQDFGAGTVVMVPAGTAHGFAFTPGTEGHVVTFADSVLQRIAQDYPKISGLFDGVRCVALAPMPPVLLLDQLVSESAVDAPAADLATAALLQLLLVAALRVLPASGIVTQPGREARLVARYRHAIEVELCNGWSVSDHARNLGVPAARLRAACLAVTGGAPLALLHARLLAEAKRRLAYGDASVTAIGYQLGFVDPGYFSRFFTRHCGQPPARWRRAVHAGIGAMG